MLEAVVTALATFLLALVLTGVARAFALAHGVLDVPNDRSSHSTPTPRGGGVAIVASTLAAASALWWRGLLDLPLYLALCGGGLAVAAVGFLDDRRPLPAAMRLAAHFAAALWALFCLGGLPPLCIGQLTVHFGWLGYVLGALGIGWTLNLFNFMDGIDGIAAGEAAFIAWGGTLLAVALGSCTARLRPRARRRRGLLWIFALELAAGEDFHGRCGQRLSRLSHGRAGDRRGA